MKIHKLGHCCMVLTINGVTVLTDPGTFTTEQNTATGIDVVLITHEHGDHLHISSLKEILKNNPAAIVVTNSSVGKLLAPEGITFTEVGDTESATVADLCFEGFGRDHAPIYQSVGLVENTGYMINNSFYFPGDNFHIPNKLVEVLALPVAGPWMKIAEALDFAKAIHPKKVLPVHDGMYTSDFAGFTMTLCTSILKSEGTEFIALGKGNVEEF